MDLDEVRRKRLRLFDSAADGSDTSYSVLDQSLPHAYSPDVNMTDDEKLARQLQHEWEQEAAQPQAPAEAHSDADATAATSDAMPGSTTDDDERIAREMQEQLDKENDPPLADPGKPTPWDVSEPMTDADKATYSKGKRRYGRAPKLPDLPATVAVVAEAVDDSDAATSVRSFAKRLKTKCGRCGKANLDTLDTIVTDYARKVKSITGKSSTQNANDYSNIILDSCAQCYSCTARSCMGCGETVSNGCEELSESFGMSMDGYSISWHCDRGRLAFLWIMLCVYDHLATHNKPQTRVPATSTSKAKSLAGPAMGRYGRSRGSLPAGIGYGGGDGFDDYNAFAEWDSQYDDTDEDDNQQDGASSPSPTAMTNSYKHSIYGPGHTLGGSAAPTTANNSPGMPSYPPALPKGALSALAFGANGPVPGYAHSGYPKAPPAKKSGIHGLSDVQHNPLADHQAALKALNSDLAKQTAELKSGLAKQKTNLEKGLSTHGRRRRDESPAKAKEDPDDALTAICAASIKLALPAIEGRDMPTEFDFDPPSTLLKMLLRSSILDRAAELLRNDCIDDVARRVGTYQPLLILVQALYSHPATSVAVSGPRCVNRAGHDLFKTSFNKPTRMIAESQDTSQPIALCLRDLTSQSKLLLSNAFGLNRKDFETDEAQQTLTICKVVVVLAEMMEANAASTTEVARQEKPSDEWQKELALLEVPDDQMLDNHAYGMEARKQSDPPAGRMRQLLKEVTRLKTSLPPGIFVRYGSSRLDVMKILIVGPGDTPYCNGLFEFDLYCGIDFPQSPPKMTFRTTGGGCAHFNPNLYTCGKVCLSLLGTWQGEKWRPNQSTILQILVSLQAMVLCDEPHCNEPGFEGDRGTQQSKAYNRRLYPLTVRYAMLDWLEAKKYALESDPYATRRWRGRRLGDADEDTAENKKKDAKEDRAGIWDEVVSCHFAVNEEAIPKMVEQWVQDKPPKPSAKGKKRYMAPPMPPTSQAFMGTGWAGRTLGGEPVGVKPSGGQSAGTHPGTGATLGQFAAGNMSPSMHQLLQTSAAAGHKPTPPPGINFPPGFPHGFGVQLGYGVPPPPPPPPGFGPPPSFGHPSGFGVPPGYGAPPGFGAPPGASAPPGPPSGPSPMPQWATDLLSMSGSNATASPTAAAKGDEVAGLSMPAYLSGSDGDQTTQVAEDTTSGPGLVAQLKGALKSLENNGRGYHDHHFQADMYDESDDDDLQSQA